MTAPAPIPLSPQVASAPRPAIAPYVAPAKRSEPELAVARVGPFVPRPWRMAIEAPVQRVADTPAAAVVAQPATPPAGMIVPASIPPYRPVRPTPIASPAMRTPLYIPSVPTPNGEAALAAAGTSEPALAEELPWIDAFLAATPAAAVPAVEAEIAAPVDEVADQVVEATTALGAALEVMEVAEVPAAAAAAVGMPTETDEWPLEEAAAEFHELRERMGAGEPQPASAASTAEPRETGPAESPAPTPLAPWSDDDLLDIMPIRHSGQTPLSSEAVVSDGELWAERARRAHEEVTVFRAMTTPPPTRDGGPSAIAPDEHSEVSADAASAEEAAHALEVLARRVRAGELALPSYDPRMGEPGALVAALAALLGARLR